MEPKIGYKCGYWTALLCGYRYNILYALLIIINLATKCDSLYTGKVLLIGFDGFRYDYTKFADTSAFDWIADKGVTVPHMDNVYPSITYPSMYSLVTGLHPESHGIVGYTIYDKSRDQWWNITNTDPHWFENGEPIWVTAGKQGKKTGSYSWIGSNVAIHGYLPDIVEPYRKNTDFYAAVDTVISWFIDHNLDLVTLYFDEPDIAGHDFGPAPDAAETVTRIQHCDDVMAYLIQQLENHNLDDVINVIIVSDHGMTTCEIPEKTVHISEYVPSHNIKVVADEGATVNILPTDGRTDAVYEALLDAHPHFQVYYKQDVPERFHFSNSERVHDIVVIADESWLMISNWAWWPESMRGFHGYDNALLTMKPIFRAFGPNFKQGYIASSIHQVDIYPLMCELLGVNSSHHNGSLEGVRDMLRYAPIRTRHVYSNSANQDSAASNDVVSIGLIVLLLCINHLI